MLSLTADGPDVLLPVKVIPGASKTRYMGELDGRAKVAVAVAPEKGKANKAVLALFAKLLGRRAGDLSVVSGKTSPLKTIRIERIDVALVRDALESARS